MILNPVTKRHVKIDGKIGKQILETTKNQGKVKSVSPKPKSVSPKQKSLSKIIIPSSDLRSFEFKGKTIKTFQYTRTEKNEIGKTINKVYTDIPIDLSKIARMYLVIFAEDLGISNIKKMKKNDLYNEIKDRIVFEN